MNFFGQNIKNIYIYIEICGASLKYIYIKSNSNNNQYSQNSTIYGKKITTFKILDTDKGNLKYGDAFIGTSNGFYILTKKDNFIKKINYVYGNITYINLLYFALTVTNKNRTLYQLNYDINYPNPNWISGPYSSN